MIRKQLTGGHATLSTEMPKVPVRSQYKVSLEGKFALIVELNCQSTSHCSAWRFEVNAL